MTERIFAVLYVSIVGLTCCYKTTVFTARRYDSAVLGVIILSVSLSVCPSVCHTRAL